MSFDKIEKISKGPNFIDNFPDAQLPFFYWRLNISDHLGENDFAIWKGLYLVVSEKALECLRDNHVTHAEADEIRIPFDDYFTSSQKYFWMSENARKYFIEMEQKKKAPLE